jgi:hypothetical protein
VGLEANCTLRYAGHTAHGKARLEEKDISFRGGALRLKVAFADIRAATAARGELRLDFPGGPATFLLGSAAEKWALKIRYPRPLIDKLGVKPGQTVSLVGRCDDASFLAQLRERTASIADATPRRGSHFIFYFTESLRDLDRLPRLRELLDPAGAIWVLWPKPQKKTKDQPAQPAPLKEDDVRKAALKSGLVDVKVVSFSATRSGLKLMIPVAKRRA